MRFLIWLISLLKSGNAGAAGPASLGDPLNYWKKCNKDKQCWASHFENRWPGSNVRGLKCDANLGALKLRTNVA